MANKRDSAYWEARLKKAHPTIWSRLKAGKIASVRKACVEAGLIRPPTRLDALKREWKKASARERERFLIWAGISRTPTSAPRAPATIDRAVATSPSTMPALRLPRPSAASPLVDVDGYLKPGVVAAMAKAMADRHFTNGPIMMAMGFKARDTRLSSALRRRWRPTLEFLDKLPHWLLAAARS